jgi:hypothetical protein
VVPPGEWAAATARWPDLLDGRAADQLGYNHEVEGSLKRYAQENPGARPQVAPLTVEDLVAFAAERGIDAGSPSARAHLAAAITARGRGIAWPPARNAPCSCGSGEKYKRCCGPVPPG